MTIQQYIEKIRESKKLTLDQNTDLESRVAKIGDLQFRIEDLFQNHELNLKFLSKIEQTLNLVFIKEENTNVCFANSDELRTEYKQSFSLQDLLDYIFAFMHSGLYQESSGIILTFETDFFWKLVKIGATLRKNLSS